MSAALRLISFLALATCARGFRAAGDLGADLESEGSSGGDTHVCCATFAKTPGNRRRSGVQVNVLHESSTGDIAACAMTMLVGGDCHSQSSCIKDCMSRFRRSKRYSVAAEEHWAAGDRFQTGEINKLLAHSQKSFEAEMKQLSLAYETELRVAKDNKDNRTQEEVKEVMQAALDKYEKAVVVAGNRSAEAASAAEQGLQEVENKAAARKQRLEQLDDDAGVPSACGGDTKRQGRYAAAQCCCSVGGIPMTVDGHFIDWGRCKNPRKYTRSGFGKMDLLGATACSPYQECARCRKLSCRNGLCPT